MALPPDEAGGLVIEAVAERSGDRLDVFVAALCPPLDRIGAGHLIRDGRVSVVGRLIKPSMHLQPGDIVRVVRPAPTLAEAEPQDLSLPILYRDAHLVVVNKPPGMATHPGPGWWKGSAVNALLHHVSPWEPIGGIATPGIVHRLDRDTGGLLIFANGAVAHQALLDAMRERRITRRYLAVARGRLSGEGTVDAPLDRDPAASERVIITPTGKRAVTHWRAIAPIGPDTLVALTLETGRTHQIRVHLASLGHPLLGDDWYGAAEPIDLRLFAYHLSFEHPARGTRIELMALPPWADPLMIGGYC